ncbi:unnamed protein product [Dovyalis caffra]|uniref:Uncharacterized protein n=1 Tax=Dovyalis caffra TaxID=77055 RepID=A0AAV1QXY0_9ROSI|nr:unnamed protein product [Dovyalis caffra]
MSTSKMNLKLLVDAKRNKVVFAEAGKDFVDFLLNLLVLPVGTVIRLLQKSTTSVGCIANLYYSLEKLNESYLQPNQNKDSLLKPTIPAQVTNPNILIPGTNKKPEDRKLFYCPGHPRYVSDIQNSVCGHCTSRRNREVKFVDTNCSTPTDKPNCDQRGYVKDLVTYIVEDDLSVSPMSMIAGVDLLNKFNTTDCSVLEERVVEFGIRSGIVEGFSFVKRYEVANFGSYNDDAHVTNYDDDDDDYHWRRRILLRRI